jgi:type IV fimbrial biogenesis protein FimT
LDRQPPAYAPRHIAALAAIRPRATNQVGITLIELMIAVAILGIVTALAAPNMRVLYINNRLDTAYNDFVTALNLARSEAIRRGVPVTLRRLSADARDWTQGWAIFVDVNGNGLRDVADPREELIRVGQPLATSLTLRSSQVVETFVPFNPDGRVALALDDGVNPLSPRATFVLCYDGMRSEGTQSRSRAVLLNSGGRARRGVDANNNGIPEDARGVDVSSCISPS